MTATTEQMEEQFRTIAAPAGAIPMPGRPSEGTSGDDLITWYRERDRVADANEPALTDCPEWCVDRHEHDWNLISGGSYAYFRTHCAMDVRNAFLAREEFATMAEHLGWGDWSVHLDLKDSRQYQNSDDLLLVATDLTQIAVKLRGLNNALVSDED